VLIVFGAPGERTFSWVKVPNPPVSGKDIAKRYGRYKRERTCEYLGRSYGHGELKLRTVVETRVIVRSQMNP